MIEQISKIGFMSKPIEPIKPLDSHYVPVQPVAAISGGIKMQGPLEKDTFTKTSTRMGYEAAVEGAKKVGMNASAAVQEAERGNPAAQNQLNIVV